MTGFHPWIRAAAAPKPPPPARAQLVVFRVGSGTYAADVRAVERVLPYTPPRPTAGAPGWVAGTMDHPEGEIPVVDLRVRFGLPPAPARARLRIIVMAPAGARFAVVADDVREVATVLESAMERVPEDFGGRVREFMRARVVHDGQELVVVDIARLLDARDLQEVDRAMAEDGHD